MKYILLVLALMPHFASANNSTLTNVESNVVSWQDFFYNQLPNTRELLTDSVAIAVCDVALGDFTRSLGKNPNAKLILRDFSKIPGLSGNILAQNEVGGTGYLYDESHGYAHSTKIATKLATFLFLKNICNLSPGQSAVLANIPGDTVGRFFIVAGQGWQKSESSIGFHEYLWRNFDTKWLSETVLQQLPNLPAMHIMGSLAGSYALGDKVQRIVLAGLNQVMTHGIVVGATLRENTKNMNAISKARVFALMAIACTAEKAFFGAVFPPASRIMMSLGASIRSYLPAFSSYSKSDEL